MNHIITVGGVLYYGLDNYSDKFKENIIGLHVEYEIELKH